MEVATSRDEYQQLYQTIRRLRCKFKTTNETTKKVGSRRRRPKNEYADGKDSLISYAIMKHQQGQFQ